MVPQTISGLASSCSHKSPDKLWNKDNWRNYFHRKPGYDYSAMEGKGVYYHKCSHTLSIGLCAQKQVLTWFSVKASAPRTETHSLALTRGKWTLRSAELHQPTAHTSSTPGNHWSLPWASILQEKRTSASQDLPIICDHLGKVSLLPEES